MRKNTKVNFGTPGVYNLRTLKSECIVRGCNLTGVNPAIKVVRSCMLLAGVALLVSCSKNLSTNVTEDFNYDGSYVASRVVEILNDDTEYAYGGSNLQGLLLIRDSVYSLRVSIQVGSGAFGRIDSGGLEISGKYVYFNTVFDSLLQSVPWGEYLPGKNEFKINYLRDDRLWTETWKRARPVADSDTSSSYIPY